MREQHMAAANNALRQLIVAGEQYRQAISSYVGLGVTETQAISHLIVTGDRSHSELASALGLTTSAATSLVDRLEHRGIAERHPHPHDRRQTLVRLTERGRAVVVDSRPWFDHAFDRIEDDCLADAVALLTTIAEDLRRQADLVTDLPRQDHHSDAAKPAQSDNDALTTEASRSATR
jgi:DNA-binding MarR family transcriptional regulator